MKKLTNKTLESILNKFNDQLKKGKEEAIKQKLLGTLDNYYTTKTVLGFDIYRYSQFKKFDQTFIPYLFRIIMERTIGNCICHEPYLFQKIGEEELIENFIDTGDGGFLIFETPLHAVTFAIYFETNIKLYNSGNVVYKDIHNAVGNISLRYAMTYDDIFKGANNFYGTAIINNARIMSRDKLNRFLLDKNSILWFNQNINGIESLQILNLDRDRDSIPILKTYKEVNKHKDDNTKDDEDEDILSLLFSEGWTSILRSDIMHIGEIRSKLDVLDIYSSHIQTKIISLEDESLDKYTVTIGNLNSSGLTD